MKRKFKILFFSTYPPTRCGLATFTQSLALSLKEKCEENPQIISIQKHSLIDNSKEIPIVVKSNSPRDYRKAADFVNESDIDAVLLQHEYGIFGGKDGKFILEFLERVKKPVITNFHSVLKEHTQDRFLLTQKIINLSFAIVVMTKSSGEILQNSFFVEPKKIFIIPHGVPKVPFEEKKQAKKRLNFENNIVLNTYGLIGRGKGIEIALESISKIVEKFPNIKYVIMGRTHPDLLIKEGEAYRKYLKRLVKSYRLEKNVIFKNRYFKTNDLLEYLSATDIYLAPQTDLKQAFSGTIAYALGCGCAVISSPTPYAKEVLNSNRGFLAYPQAEAFQKKLEFILENKKILRKKQTLSHRYAMRMRWDKVSLKYAKIIKLARRKTFPDIQTRGMNPPNLKHLVRLTDNFGIVQHSKNFHPDLSFGYSLDDQSRALIAALKHSELFDSEYNLTEKLANTYLDFILGSVDKDNFIHNFFNWRGEEIDQEASPDCIARTFWALSIALKNKRVDEKDKKRIRNILKYFSQKPSNQIHPASYNLLANIELNSKEQIGKISDFLITEFKKNSDRSWHWFSKGLTWANGITPYALAKAYQVTYDKTVLSVVKKSVKFLEKTTEFLYPNPIGQNGWYYRGEERATFDQQPIEAAKMVLLYNELYKIEKLNMYKRKAKYWMSWYLGNNINSRKMIDRSSGGVYDGLTQAGVNRNQGAESIITYLLAYMSFKD